MKLLFAAISLWAVAVLAFRGDRIRSNNRFTEPREVQPFRSGYEFRYRLDTQISTGFASVSEQHAVTRLQCDVAMQFQSDRSVILRLEDITMGSMNRDIPEPEKVFPMEMFERTQIEGDEARELRYPVTFDYVDGIVERIRFHSDDKPWSKNIKRSVLNMLQLNLKQRTGMTELKPIHDQYDEETRRDTTEKTKMFVLPEMTLEGECQTSYVLNKMSPRNKYNTYFSENSRDNLEMLNVTKSIDFKQCKKIADIRYGPRVEKPCDKCELEELEERKLDRTTVLRHVLVGNTEQYGIHKIEMISHYMFKMINAEQDKPMHTVVAGELNYLRAESSRNSMNEDSRSMGKEESIVYSTEWDEDEKRFYMYGDEEFPSRSSPFQRVPNKVGQVEKLINKLVHLWSDKVNGIENEATITFSRLIEFVRMCSVEELKSIYSKVSRGGNDRLTETEQLKAEDLFIDALSNAGTKNSIEVLVEKILKQDIPTSRAVRAITFLKGVPVPSDKQIEMLLNLCTSEVAKRSEPLRQTCWLTTGAIMGELCDDELTTEDAFEQNTPKPVCHKEKKQKWVKVIMDFYRKVETRYEKILALKTLGNAGLDESIFELEKVINNPREAPVVRMQAIDSMRRLRAVMPRKIQRILMPVFQNIRERPEIRMAALSQMLPTIPEKHLLDQIGFTLLREPSRQVKSYVYTAMKFLSKSPIQAEKTLAEHLKALLKLAGITEEDEQEIIRGSRFYRVPFYSAVQREGFYAEWESMVGPDNFLPKHLSASIDTLFSGILEKNGIELRLTQENLEQWMEKIWNTMADSYYRYPMKKSELRANRKSESDSSEENDDTRSIFSGLKIQRRQREHYSRSDSETEMEPFGMFCLRYADIDYVILPIDEEIMPEKIKMVLRGEKPTMRHLAELFDFLKSSRPFRQQAAFNLLESSMKIPTSMGIPVRMWHALPVLASIEGHLKGKMSGSELSVETMVHPVMTATHIKRVEVWCPIVMSGAETSQTLELSLPVNSVFKVDFDSTKGATWTVKIPETKTRIFGFHSLPMTYTAEKDRNTKMHKMPMVKQVENMELQDQLRSIDTTYGVHTLGLPLKVQGDIHMPRDWTNYKSILTTMLTTENHIHAEFHPNSDSPRELVMTFDGETFIPITGESSKPHRELKGFYSKAKFDDEVERYYESREDSDEEDENKLNSFLDSYEPRKMYQHRVRVELKTVGGRQQKYCKMEAEAACDERLKYCNAKFHIKRSPFFEETRDWDMTLKLQTLYPEYVSDIDDLSMDKKSEKHQKFVCQMECEWGSERKQSILVNINGEQFKPKLWLKKMSDIERYSSYDNNKLQEQMKLKIAFLNKYDISAEYKLQPMTQNMFSRWFSMLKAWNFWSTKTQPLMNNARSEGSLHMTVVIDPITHEHLNMTVKTPSERCVIDSIRMPMKVKPFELVRPHTIRASSFIDMVNTYSSKSQPKCMVDGRKIQSFDEVTFKAPLTKCYSVLAKDCSREDPRFAVLMKKIDEEKNKLKVISGSNTIEVQRESSKDKLMIKINGERITNKEELLDYGIDYSEDEVQIDTRDVSVKFDGKKCWIKLSEFHKNTQCGLCGHYNDNTDDEFRMGNNEHTYDLKAFHKSYSIQDEECRSDLEETHRRERYEPMNYDEDYESKEQREESRDESRDEENKKPYEKSYVAEYNHKICFSEKPVKECPRGTEPSNEKEQKLQMICFPRTSTEARQLLRESRRNQRTILDLPKQKPSYTETVQVPTSCKVY